MVHNIIMAQPHIMIIRKASTSQPAIRSALKKLHAHGSSALKPQPIVTPDGTSSGATRQKWKRPDVSRRVANDLRKAAIRQGTYGSYNPETGIGWDKSWDAGLFGQNGNSDGTSINSGRINWMEIRGFKEPTRERTRESRAQRIEALLSAADDKIVEYRQFKRDNKPEGGIENVIKRMIRRSTKK
jgi:hypothetical protein